MSVLSSQTATKRYLKLSDYFGEPGLPGTFKRLNQDRVKSRAERRSIKQRRKQGARMRAKR